MKNIFVLVVLSLLGSGLLQGGEMTYKEAMALRDRIKEANPKWDAVKNFEPVKLVHTEGAISAKEITYASDALKPCTENDVVYGVFLNGRGLNDLRCLAGAKLKFLGLSGLFDLRKICQAKEIIDLEKLYIIQSYVTDLDFLADSKIDYLYIVDSPIGDYSSIAKLPLKTLRLRKLHIVSLPDLSSCPIEKLVLRDITGMKDFAKLPYKTLSNFTLYGLECDNYAELAKCTKLKRLAISTILENFDPMLLSQLPIEDLSLSRCTDITTTAFLQEMPLKYLRLWIIEYKIVADLSGIRNKSIEFLALYGDSISDISAVATLKELKYLGLRFVSVKDLSPLKNLRLKELYISNLKYFPTLPEWINGITKKLEVGEDISKK